MRPKAVSLLTIGVCFTIGVNGKSTLWQGDESPDFVSRRDPVSKEDERLQQSGVIVADGQLTLAFGAIDVPLARDTRGAIHFIELLLAGGVADTLGLLLTLIWTAGFLPSFLEGRNIAVLLAKPAPRGVLLFGKYLGVLCFVLFQSVIFVVGTWIAIGVRTGFWDASYLLCVPLLLLHFSIFYAVSVFLAVWTHNAVVCVIGSLAFWGVAWSMNFGRHALIAANDMLSSTLQSQFLSSLIDFGYWVFPKPADLAVLLFDSLVAADYFGPLLNVQTLSAHGFSMFASVASSLAFAAVVLYTAGRMFRTADYRPRVPRRTS